MNIIFAQNQSYISFRSYSPEYICTTLCKGACCNHGTLADIRLKMATDELNLKKIISGNSDTLKRFVLAWSTQHPNPNVIRLNNEVNKILAEVFEKPELAKAKLPTINKLNQEMAEIVGDSEVFLAVTNPIFKNNLGEAALSSEINVCMYKDPETNKCTIYYGLNDIKERPSACKLVGSNELPCLWLNPEKINEVASKIRIKLANAGCPNLPPDVVFRYIIDQFNLNSTWAEEIYKPLNKIGKQ
ncbi:MAG: hypothetical protein MJ237_05030 [bacterium]|nr:hypothetical protein [bacterium]